MSLDRVGYLIGISGEENELCAGAVNHERQGDIRIVDEAVHQMRRIDCGGYQCYHRHAIEHNSYGSGYSPPCPFVVKVEDVYVERKHLSNEYDDIFTQPAVSKHEAASGQTERPVACGRDHSLESLGHDPLHQLPRTIAQLRHEPYEEGECEHLRTKIVQVESRTK